MRRCARGACRAERPRSRLRCPRDRQSARADARHSAATTTTASGPGRDSAAPLSSSRLVPRRNRRNRMRSTVVEGTAFALVDPDSRASTSRSRVLDGPRRRFITPPGSGSSTTGSIPVRRAMVQDVRRGTRGESDPAGPRTACRLPAPFGGNRLWSGSRDFSRKLAGTSADARSRTTTGISRSVFVW